MISYRPAKDVEARLHQVHAITGIKVCDIIDALLSRELDTEKQPRTSQADQIKRAIRDLNKNISEAK
ncbi:MAG TPA: hypothetical protein VN653_17935 [Anaerolineales bacterium]|nr:hypothetical protein [Anaerolineales bacterium]